MKTVVLASMFSLSTAVSFSPVSDSVVVPKAAAAFVLPVLRAQYAVLEREEREADEAEEKALARVLAARSPVTNEALAVLLGFYIGESSGEDITCEAISRGKIMLPLLQKYEAAEIVVPGIDPSQTRPDKTLYTIVTSGISAGKGCKREE